MRFENDVEEKRWSTFLPPKEKEQTSSKIMLTQFARSSLEEIKFSVKDCLAPAEILEINRICELEDSRLKEMTNSLI